MAMTEAKLRRLESPAADPVEVSAIIGEDEGRLPQLRIDITDPPSPVVAMVGAHVATAARANDAIRELGRVKARLARAAQREP